MEDDFWSEFGIEDCDYVPLSPAAMQAEYNEIVASLRWSTGQYHRPIDPKTTTIVSYMIVPKK